ncbi:MAG: hypothetical protein AB1698_01685 [Pseudomonadota bacterium]
MRYTLRTATTVDAMRLAQTARGVDKREWEDATGLPFRDQIVAAVSSPGAMAYTVCHAGVSGSPPLLIWGVDFVSRHLGQIWMAASEQAVPLATSIHETMSPSLRLLDAAYPSTVAYADRRNSVHLVWLRRLGWEAQETITIGPKGLPYTKFERLADVWTSPRRRLYGGGGNEFNRPAPSG